MAKGKFNLFKIGENIMIRLRPYKMSDANYLINWINDKRQFSMWCADKFTYPLTEKQLKDYFNMYEEDELGWIFTALDEVGKPVGHFLMKKADYQNESVHLGFIIVSKEVRGKGYGKEMVGLAVKYAFEILKVKRVTLGVFSNNPAAHNCYKSAGLKDERYLEDIFTYEDEKWGLYDMAIERDK